MAIDGPSPLNSAESSRVLGVPTGATRPAPPAPTEPAPAGFTLTPDLARLLASVRQTAEVRQEVIGEVVRRLNAGELFTRQAADQVVQGLLEAQPPEAE